MDKNGYFSRTRAPLFQNRNKSKLLSFALKRIVHKTLNISMGALKKNAKNYSKRLYRMQRLSVINSEMCVMVAWERIKSYSKSQKSKDRIIKDMLILARKIEKTLLKESFLKLQSNAHESNNASFRKINELKKVLMGQCLKRLYVNRKKSSFSKLKSNIMVGRQNKRILVINTILNGAEKRYILYAWSKLLSIKRATNEQLDEQLENLNLQLQDMKVQVENKNQNIIRLQEEIAELKQNSIIRNEKPADSSYLFNNSFNNRSGGHNRSRSKVQNNSFEKDSNDGSFVREGSFGSLLGLSILSYRSRGSTSANKYEECACNSCGYREKSQKYKATNDTLKKQLQIIKTQLDFTKDMNQHLQNEIRNQLSNQERENKIQKLRAELRESHKQRENLREKVIKYQKYVNKLKLEFRNKIEEIYRRVKKGA